MKLQFDEQQYQLDAIKSITKIFEGQSIQTSNFSVSTGEMLGRKVTELGIGNHLELSDEEVLENVQNIQTKNHLPKSTEIQDWNFTVEMETGTGKSYVYIRSIYELNKKYGFTKFIIVVPSVAIREGVYKSFQITEEHFDELFPGQWCHFFKYDSNKLEQVKDYATNENIEVMIINIDSFRRSFVDPAKETKANLIHRQHDSLSGQRPIQFIQSTNPIVIIDEPQSVDHTENAKEAIASLNPLCKFRFSATHREHYNLMYKLDPVDAYERNLVKKIEVLSVHADDDYNKPYIKLLSVSIKSGYQASVLIDVQQKNGEVKRVSRIVNSNEKRDLFIMSGERDIYQGYVIAGIDCHPDNESIEFENGKMLKVGEVIGPIDDDTLKRYQIRETIRTHLDKELKLVQRGIKVLTLFFIDKVANYRIYSDNGSTQNGKYAQMFEEEYALLIKFPKYHSLFSAGEFNTTQKAAEVHDGYFAMDRKGNFKDSRSKKDGSLMANQGDKSAFELIMKDKERLLSFDTPLRFIFSHSALKEGWDNPNVFQICTLVETKDTLTKRQKIGRGLRLPVNHDGVRQYDQNLNVLTVIANESYEDFASSLQVEIEKETGVKLGYIKQHSFAAIIADYKSRTVIGYDQSEEIYNFLLLKKYIHETGEVSDSLKEALAADMFIVPKQFSEIKDEIERIIRDSIKKFPIFNKRETVPIRINKEISLSDEFLDLWERIKHKTIYSVDLNTDKLIANTLHKIQELPPFRARKIRRESSYIHVDRSGITGENQIMQTEVIVEQQKRLPDILRYLQGQTNLKRRTLIEILTHSNRLNDFKKNPQHFMEDVLRIIKNEKRKLIIDDIKYERLHNHECYHQSLFEHKELLDYIKVNDTKLHQLFYNYAQNSFHIERDLADVFNRDDNVKFFIKLPAAFKFDTPLGNYKPDWAILIKNEQAEKLYFIEGNRIILKHFFETGDVVPFTRDSRL